MTGRRALVGLSLLCALAFTAFSAGTASAATSGTTAFTCSPTAPLKDYADAHCDTTEVNGKFGHVEIETTGSAANCPSGIANTCTEITTTNAGTRTNTTEATNAVLEATVGGIATKLTSTTVVAHGFLENKLEGEVHKITVSKFKVTYTNVTVNNPANCKVHSPGQPAGTVVTNELMVNSVEGTPMMEEFKPEVGTEFVKLEFENNGGTCAIAGVNPGVTTPAGVLGEPQGQMAAGGGKGASTGATVKLNVTKASHQLKVGGQDAALTQLDTVKMSPGATEHAIVTTGPPF